MAPPPHAGEGQSLTQRALVRRSSSRTLLIVGAAVLVLPVAALVYRDKIAAVITRLEPAGALNHEPDIAAPARPPGVQNSPFASSSVAGPSAGANPTGSSVGFVQGLFVPASPTPAPAASAPEQAPTAPSEVEPEEVALGDLKPLSPLSKPRAAGERKLRRVPSIGERDKLSHVETGFNADERDIRIYQKLPEGEREPEVPTAPQAEAPSQRRPLEPAAPPRPPPRRRLAGRAQTGSGGAVSMKAKMAPTTSAESAAAAEMTAAQTSVIGGAGASESGHRVQQGAPDALPAPNPEWPKTADGPCPRASWWKNSSTGLCYYRKDSCSAANSGQGDCVQTRR